MNHHFRYFSVSRSFRLVLIFLSLLCLATPVFSTSVDRVLLISSYHPAFPTFFDQAQGIRDAFSGHAIELDIEFLDSKRFPFEQTAARMVSLLKEKLSKLPPYHAIMAADDNALKFVLLHQKELFHDTPVVFLGINNLDLALQQNENPLVTGVVEGVSMADTLQLIHTLQPQVTAVKAIVDSTTSGQSDLKTYYQAAKGVPDLTFSELSLAKLSWEELKDKLKNLNEHEALLLLSAYRDKAANVLSFNESLGLIVGNSPVPVYHLWYHGLGEGIIGGKVISQYEQGKTAAQIVLKIIGGTPASQIPVNMESPNRYIFDYEQLKRYDIATNLLPENSELLNLPHSFYRENKELTLLIGSVFFILVTALCFTLYILFLRRRVQRQLQESEDKYRTLIEGTNDAVVSIDQNWIIQSWNTGAAVMYGYTEQEIIGSHVSRLIPLDKLEENYEHITKMFSQDKYRNFETENLTREGKRITVDINLNRQLNQDGSVLAVSGFIRNITDRREAENALQESEEKFSSAFHNAPVLMAISDVESHILLEVNDAFLTATGYEPKDLIGKSVQQIGLVPEDEFAGLVKEFRREGRVHNYELNLIKADQTRLSCLYSGEILNMGDSSKVLAIGADLTERKKLERDLLQAQKMEAIGTLAGGIAHDFNNILAAIIGYTELSLQACPSNTEMAEDLQEVLKAGNRAKGLVQQILAFSRQGESEQIPIQPASVIRDNLKMIRPSLPATIEIVQNLNPNIGTVLIAPTHINQIVVNLCTNAYHAMEKHGGKLSVTLDSTLIDDQNYMHLEICDTGTGMDQQVQKRIFEPYFTTKETGKGTGMGLSIVHGLVASYKGRLRVKSEPGQGTCISIFLPICTEKNETVQTTDCQEPGGAEHILLVDDEEMLASMGKTMLTRLGYSVTSVTSSLEALELFNSNPREFDLVITDQTMPNMTGIELAEKLLRIRPELPIILCTGFSSIVSEDEAKTVGIREFALKPLSRKNLSVLIRKALDD